MSRIRYPWQVRGELPFPWPPLKDSALWMHAETLKAHHVITPRIVVCREGTAEGALFEGRLVEEDVGLGEGGRAGSGGGDGEGGDGSGGGDVGGGLSFGQFMSYLLHESEQHNMGGSLQLQ